MGTKKSMKRFSYLVSIVIFCVIFMGSVSAASKPKVLKVATWNPPPPFPISTSAVKWANMIEEKSDGEVKLQFFWAGGLASLRDTYRTVQTGVAEIGFWIPGNIPGIHSLNEYTALPMLGVDSMETATKVFHEMRKKFPELDAEFKGLRLIYASAMPPIQFHFSNKKKVQLPDDVKGIKIIGSANHSDFINTVGGVAVFKPPSDYYMSLQKGLVQGVFNHWPFINAFKLEDLFTSHTEAGDGGFNFIMNGFWMNRKVWDSLSPKAQNAFDESAKWLEQEDTSINNRLIDLARKKALEQGHQIFQLTAAEKQAWFEKTEPIRQEWVKKMESQGKPGQAVYEEALRLIKKYNTQ